MYHCINYDQYSVKKISGFWTLLFIFFSFYGFIHPVSSQVTNKTAGTPGKVVYQQNCLTCHQTDGSGVPRLYPTLIKSTTISAEPTKLIKIILNGLEGVEIDGNHYASAMPGFSGSLTDKQIADLATYLRQNFGNKGTAVTAVQVKSVRNTKSK